MQAHKQIIVGIDFSLCSGNALREAVRLRNPNETVIALHVIDEKAFNAASRTLNWTKEEVMREGKEQLEFWVTEQLGGTEVLQCEVALGNPFVELLEGCYRHDADLLVLGSHGIEGEDNRTGTVATKCARKAPLEVMLVRYHQDRPFQNVAACIDIEDRNDRVVKEAVSIAKRFEAGLKFVYVIRPADVKFTELAALAHSLPPNSEPREEKAEAEIEDYLAQFSDELEGIESQIHVVESVQPASGICRFVKDHDIDLLVLSSRGRTGLNWVLMGTTAEKVIRDTTCSALILKPEDFHPPKGV